jgi:hypothetical protein
MKQLLILLVAGLFLHSEIRAQKTTTKFVQITTVESVVGGGLGRSKMIITKEDGTTEEKEMSNLFSMTGINFKNIKDNDATILQTLKTYTDDGWKLFSNSPLTLSPGTNGAGIFMTRYLLSKDAEGPKDLSKK